MTTHIKLAEHAQLIIFCPVAWKKWVHENVSFRSVYNGQLRLCMSLLCDITGRTKFDKQSCAHAASKLKHLAV